MLASWRHPERVQGDGIRVALLVLGTIAAAQSLFYVQGRHRLAVEPLLMVLSGSGLVVLRRIAIHLAVGALGVVAWFYCARTAWRLVRTTGSSAKLGKPPGEVALTVG